MIVLTKEEAALALGWSFDRDWPMLGPDEHALQDRLRAVVAPEPEPTCTKDWCCTACEGAGWTGQYPCSDCYGTGHTHRQATATIHPAPALVDDPEVECKKCLWRFPISSVHECPARVIAENEMVVDRDEQYEALRAERIVALKDFADELERCIEPDTGDPELMDMIDVINLVRERAKTLGLNDGSL